MPPVKKHTHTTPRLYIKRFATDGAVMTDRLDRPIGVSEVGVRKKFYTVEGRDGPSDEVEDGLAQLENVAGQALTQIAEGRLPLTIEHKSILAQFTGLQMARGVKYREVRGRGVIEQEEHWRGQIRTIFLKYKPGESAAADDYAAAYDLNRLTTKNEHIRGAVQSGNLLATALINMRWEFVRFRRPLLLGCDQPVACWLGPYVSSPWAPMVAAEVRMPLGPDLALVATWHDGPDITGHALGLPPAGPLDESSHPPTKGRLDLLAARHESASRRASP